MTPCYRPVLRLGDGTVDAVRAHLERHVAPHLAPDVSNYAPGRTRAWLQVEAPLGPSQPWRPGLASARLWPWLDAGLAAPRPRRRVPDLGGGSGGSAATPGSSWHRDAAYARLGRRDPQPRALPLRDRPRPGLPAGPPGRPPEPALRRPRRRLRLRLRSTSTASSTRPRTAGRSCSGGQKRHPVAARPAGADPVTGARHPTVRPQGRYARDPTRLRHRTGGRPRRPRPQRAPQPHGPRPADRRSTARTPGSRSPARRTSPAPRSGWSRTRAST